MFCSECGKQIADDNRFCPECGAQISYPAVPCEMRGARHGERTGGNLTVAEIGKMEQLSLGAAIAIGVAALLNVMFGNLFGMLIFGGISAGIYLLVHKNIKDRNYQNVKGASMGFAIVCGLFGLLHIIIFADFGGIIGIVAAVLLFQVYQKL
ncbi:MAG: zinc ribbon domain-containing protein [bacterium]|nr:zinc ribbon domain-containing protein [bacterium]